VPIAIKPAGSHAGGFFRHCEGPVPGSRKLPTLIKINRPSSLIFVDGPFLSLTRFQTCARFMAWAKRNDLLALIAGAS
jgi:hypothetical protein